MPVEQSPAMVAPELAMLIGLRGKSRYESDGEGGSVRRRSFLKMCGLLGLSLPFGGCRPQSTSSNDMPDFADPSSRDAKHSDYSGSVIIVGAGAAGLSAGFLLKQRGVDFTIVEAAPVHGGRMKRDSSFADFPLSLGAEWLHVDRTELAAIVNDPHRQLNTQLAGYAARDQFGYYADGELHMYPLFDVFGDSFADQKFINSSWYDFFDTYVVPAVTDSIHLNTHIDSIAYNDSGVVKLRGANGSIFQADVVIFTGSLQVLQNNAVTFTSIANQENSSDSSGTDVGWYQGVHGFC